MNKLIFIMLAGFASASFAAEPAMPAATSPHMDTVAYKQMMDKAANDYKMAKAQCDTHSGNAKDICVEQAKAARAHTESDAVVQYKNDKKSVQKAEIAVANAEYDLAKAKCADMAGTEKRTCLSTAKSAQVAAIADAKAEKHMADVAQTGEDCSTMTGTSKASCLARTKSEMAGNTVADSVITTKVKAELLKEPNLKSLDVHVETTQGVVSLSGFVPSQTEVDKAVAVARNVKGVTQVQNSLRVDKNLDKK
jgi:hyperosmotically inducible periplasmic protein